MRVKRLDDRRSCEVDGDGQGLGRPRSPPGQLVRAVLRAANGSWQGRRRSSPPSSIARSVRRGTPWALQGFQGLMSHRTPRSIVAELGRQQRHADLFMLTISMQRWRRSERRLNLAADPKDALAVKKAAAGVTEDLRRLQRQEHRQPRRGQGRQGPRRRVPILDELAGMSHNAITAGDAQQAARPFDAIGPVSPWSRPQDCEPGTAALRGSADRSFEQPFSSARSSALWQKKRCGV